MKPDYCTQNEGDCPTCSLVNYGRDCRNHKIHALAGVAQELTGGNLAACAKLLNDAGADPRLDEIQPDPGAFVHRPVLVDLLAIRAGDRVGRKAGELLRS